MNQTLAPKMDTRKLLVIVLTICAAFIALAFWGGMPSASQIPAFLLGVLALLAVGAAICFAGWYLLYRPLPQLPQDAALSRQSILSPLQRQVIGVALIIGGMMSVIGGTWDEGWHIKYGLPFGKDFFWRPHILLYLTFIVIIVVAGIAEYLLIRFGKGNWSLRFRADPMLGFTILIGIFLVYALPADPIWHSIYGTDLSAFSIPHVLIALLLILTWIAGCGLILSSLPARTWRSPLHLGVLDVMPILAYVSMLLVGLLLLTADWADLQPADMPAHTSIIFQRPDWLFPVLIVFMAVWVGTLANHSLRCYGASTLVGILAVASRLVLLNVLDHPIRDANPWLVCLPVMVAIDVLYAYRLRRHQSISWWLVPLAAAVGMIGVLPLINRLFLYPQVNLGNLPLMLIAPILAAYFASWLGRTVGDYMAVANRQVAPAGQDARPENIRSAEWITVGLLLVAVVFVVWFVATATPPIL